ncbi:MAG: hypothetical protein LBD73_04865 [Deferribacteraceae bacterium]|jgi:hypothetical protein|nr:hypothetical protein [Deferribacteraceae bacterium]
MNTLRESVKTGKKRCGEVKLALSFNANNFGIACPTQEKNRESKIKKARGK